MLKKVGILTVGVTAAMLAAAPIASAGVDESDNNDKDSSHDDDRDKGHGNNSGDQDGTGNIQCNAEGGGVDNDVENRGVGAIGQVAGPVLSGNTGQLLSCNSFLNDFLNDNEVNVLS